MRRRRRTTRWSWTGPGPSASPDGRSILPTASPTTTSSAGRTGPSCGPTRKAGELASSRSPRSREADRGLLDADPVGLRGARAIGDVPVVACRERHPAAHGIRCVVVGGLDQGLVVRSAQRYGRARAAKSRLRSRGARVGNRARLTAVCDARQAAERPGLIAAAGLGTGHRADHVGEQALASGGEAPAAVGAGVRRLGARLVASPRAAPAGAPSGTGACVLRPVSTGRALPVQAVPFRGCASGQGACQVPRRHWQLDLQPTMPSEQTCVSEHPHRCCS